MVEIRYWEIALFYPYKTLSTFEYIPAVADFIVQLQQYIDIKK